MVTQGERDIVSLIGETEKEEKILRTWKKKAKGRPMRWRILRDVVACVSLAWMTTEQVQIAMSRLWALKNKTTRDILEELEQGRAVEQKKHDQRGFMWGATEIGVAFWVGSKSAIPAITARVASDSAFVSGYEA